MATIDTAMHSLQIKRHLGAPPARVYSAWTEEEDLARWFAPSPDFDTVVHQLDVRAGGKYRIEMKSPDGSSHIAVGEYRELAAPNRLAFTWRWEGSPMTDTLVTVELQANGNGTDLTLTHTLFESEELRDQHTEGWTGCLGRLEPLFAPKG
jgi:uncharacterized protein YndB with AHSA1/START domain